MRRLGQRLGLRRLRFVSIIACFLNAHRPIANPPSPYINPRNRHRRAVLTNQSGLSCSVASKYELKNIIGENHKIPTRTVYPGSLPVGRKYHRIHLSSFERRVSALLESSGNLLAPVLTQIVDAGMKLTYSAERSAKKHPGESDSGAAGKAGNSGERAITGSSEHGSGRAACRQRPVRQAAGNDVRFENFKFTHLRLSCFGGAERKRAIETLPPVNA